MLGLSQNVFIFVWIYICIFSWLFCNLTALPVHTVQKWSRNLENIPHTCLSPAVQPPVLILQVQPLLTRHLKDPLVKLFLIFFKKNAIYFLIQLFIWARGSVLVLSCSFLALLSSSGRSVLVGFLNVVDFKLTSLKCTNLNTQSLWLLRYYPYGTGLVDAFSKGKTLFLTLVLLVPALVPLLACQLWGRHPCYTSECRRCFPSWLFCV